MKSKYLFFKKNYYQSVNYLSDSLIGSGYDFELKQFLLQFLAHSKKYESHNYVINFTHYIKIYIFYKKKKKIIHKKVNRR